MTLVVLAAICHVFSALVLGYKSFNVSIFMYQFLRRMRYLYEFILNSYFQLLAASFFDIQSEGVSKVSCTNSYVDLEICMSILRTDSMGCWQHHFRHMNTQCCQKYLILNPRWKQKFVWPYFKQLVCVTGSIIYGIRVAISLESMSYQFLRWFGNLYDYPSNS